MRQPWRDSEDWLCGYVAPLHGRCDCVYDERGPTRAVRAVCVCLPRRVVGVYHALAARAAMVWTSAGLCVWTAVCVCTRRDPVDMSIPSLSAPLAGAPLAPQHTGRPAAAAAVHPGYAPLPMVKATQFYADPVERLCERPDYWRNIPLDDVGLWVDPMANASGVSNAPARTPPRVQFYRISHARRKAGGASGDAGTDSMPLKQPDAMVVLTHFFQAQFPRLWPHGNNSEDWPRDQYKKAMEEAEYVVKLSDGPVFLPDDAGEHPPHAETVAFVDWCCALAAHGARLMLRHPAVERYLLGPTMQKCQARDAAMRRAMANASAAALSAVPLGSGTEYWMQEKRWHSVFLEDIAQDPVSRPKDGGRMITFHRRVFAEVSRSSIGDPAVQARLKAALEAGGREQRMASRTPPMLYQPLELFARQGNELTAVPRGQCVVDPFDWIVARFIPSPYAFNSNSGKSSVTFRLVDLLFGAEGHNRFKRDPGADMKRLGSLVLPVVEHYRKGKHARTDGERDAGDVAHGADDGVFGPPGPRDTDDAPEQQETHDGAARHRGAQDGACAAGDPYDDPELERVGLVAVGRLSCSRK